METPEHYEQLMNDCLDYEDRKLPPESRAIHVAEAQVYATAAIAAAICADRDHQALIKTVGEDIVARVSRPTNPPTPVEHSSLPKY